MNIYKTFLPDGQKVEVGISPDNVQNYQEKVKIEYEKFNGKFSMFTCKLLVLISEDLKTKIPKKPKKLNAFFITINPKKDIEFEKLRQAVLKGITKKWILDTTYCFEQRSEEPNIFSGFHCHLLVRTNRKKYKTDVLNEWASTCRKICPKNGINVKYIKKQKDFDQVLNYMSGNKEEKKLAKVENDKLFRKKYNLKDFYK